MSTWISRRAAFIAALAAAALGAGCMDGAEVTMGTGAGFVPRPAGAVTVAGGAVTIAGPAGYCIDTAASRDGGQGAFVLLASCAAIGNRAAFGRPRAVALLTATVSADAAVPAGLTVEALKTLTSTPTGRGALARDGNASSVAVLAAREAPGALFLHLRDTSQGGAAGLGRDYWRGLFAVAGHVVTITVNSFDGRALTPAAGFATLDAFAARIRAENATAGPAVGA